MKRILYLTDTLMAGGTEQQLTALITRLDRGRFEPHVLCLYGEKAGRSLHFAEPLRAANVPVHVLDLSWSPLAKLRAIFEIAFAVRRLRPHILHAVNYHGSLLMRLARPLLPIRLKLVSAVQVEYVRKQLLYERLSAWMCAAVVVNSPHLQRQLIDVAKVTPARVPLIYNGVDLARFNAPTVTDIRQQVAPSVGQVIVMFGRVTKQKSPHLLAQAVGILKQRGALPSGVRVLLIGESENAEAQAQLDAAITNYQLADIIRQLPPTAQPEAFYHAADFTALPSLWEGLPNVVLESLAAGRPMILSEAANAAGVIEHGRTGWVVRTGDADHLAETLHTALALSDAERRHMRAACIAAAAPFAMDKMVAAYQALYARL